MIWAAIWNWMKQIPRWVWYVILALAGLWALRADARQDGKKSEKAKQKERDLQIRRDAEDYIETVKEEGDEAAEQAIERRDTASPLDPERMPDAQRDRIFGRNRAPEGSG
jgi:hypothetical protein